MLQYDRYLSPDVDAAIALVREDAFTPEFRAADEIRCAA
ncbi:hypothetical protein NONI108955_19275 [Nocardia ninae]